MHVLIKKFTFVISFYFQFKNFKKRNLRTFKIKILEFYITSAKLEKKNFIMQYYFVKNLQKMFLRLFFFINYKII